MTPAPEKTQTDEAEPFEVDGPDARHWPADDLIGGLISDLRVLEDVMKLMSGSAPEEISASYGTCLSFLRHSVRQVKADLATAIISKYPALVQIPPDRPAPPSALR